MTGNSNSAKGVTLLELLVAVSLLTLIILAGGGIYISGWNMFRDAQNIAQAHRNAVTPMMHMAKQVQQGTYLGPPGHTYTNMQALEFAIDDNGTPGISTDDDTIIYSFDGVNGSITFSRHRYPENAEDPLAVIGTHITACNFTYSTSAPVVGISITATNNLGDDPYSINSSVSLRYMSAQ